MKVQKKQKISRHTQKSIHRHTPNQEPSQEISKLSGYQVVASLPKGKRDKVIKSIQKLIEAKKRELAYMEKNITQPIRDIINESREVLLSNKSIAVLLRDIENQNKQIKAIFGYKQK